MSQYTTNQTNLADLKILLYDIIISFHHFGERIMVVEILYDEIKVEINGGEWAFDFEVIVWGDG